MELIDGRLYTPEEVSENGWLGRRSPEALRKAASPGRGQLQHTKSGGKICFSRADILANQEAGLELAKTQRPVPVPSAPRRVRRASAADIKPVVTVLKPRPGAARRRKAS